MCQCADISFGTVDEIMNWYGEPVLYHFFESCKVKVRMIIELELCDEQTFSSRWFLPLNINGIY